MVPLKLFPSLLYHSIHPLFAEPHIRWVFPLGCAKNRDWREYTKETTNQQQQQQQLAKFLCLIKNMQWRLKAEWQYCSTYSSPQHLYSCFGVIPPRHPLTRSLSWVSEPIWWGRENCCTCWESKPGRPAHGQSLYWIKARINLTFETDQWCERMTSKLVGM